MTLRVTSIKLPKKERIEFLEEKIKIISDKIAINETFYNSDSNNLKRDLKKYSEELLKLKQ
jgi:hypothetical protein